jgi:hypothetical protein
MPDEGRDRGSDILLGTNDRPQFEARASHEIVLASTTTAGLFVAG